MAQLLNSKDMSKPIFELQQIIHDNAKAKGFYDSTQSNNVSEKLMLIVSEIAEAQEADRKNHHCKVGNLEYANALSTGEHFKEYFELNIKNSFGDELADAMIRIMDLAEWKGISLEFHIEQKMRYNSMREKLHGKKH